jgi:hypothetical protein
MAIVNDEDFVNIRSEEGHEERSLEIAMAIKLSILLASLIL